MSGNSEILKVSSLLVSFHGDRVFNAVDHVSFRLYKGKTLAIVGESGSGKSLTALALMGLLPNAATLSGTVLLNTSDGTVNLDSLEDNDKWQRVRGKEIGMIFQEPMSSLNPVMKIGHQLAESIQTHQKVSKQQAEDIAIDWLQQVQLPNLSAIFKRYPHQLSGGQKQRVMIAMAMCNHPVLLIADEPTTALDVTVQMEVIALMKELQEQTGTAMIFITHDLALAATISDEVLVMYRGKMIEYGETSTVLHNPAEPYTKALIACKPSPDKKGKLLPIVADFMGEHEPADNTLFAPTVKEILSKEHLLRVQELRIWFPGDKNMFGKSLNYFKAVDGVSFELAKDEVLGLVGESGCGKSTLSRSLIGLIPVHDGEIIFDGQDISKFSHKEWRRLRREVQMIFQDPFASLNPRMTIGDMLTEPLTVHRLVSKAEIKKEARRLLDLVHLPSDALHRYPHQFSGGQRQRVGIARALALRPKLIICDESVSALDVSVQAQILNLLKELQAEFELSYLFISHDLSVVHYISDRVLVMQAGKIVERGEADKVLKRPEHPYTQKLIAAMPELK